MIQHFVPRVYLKHFAEKRNASYYLDVYDKQVDRTFNTNIINICAEKDLYTLSEDSTVAANKLAIEKIYSDGLEPMYDSIFGILTNDTIFEITNQQRIEILLAIFQLYMRNPRFIRISIDHHTARIHQLILRATLESKKGITYLEEDFSFQEWSENQIVAYFSDKVQKQFKENHVTGIGELGTFHEYAKLEVSKCKVGGAFFTSDNPLVLQDMVEKENEHPLQKTKEFVIALSPEYSLKIYHDNTYNLNSILRPIVPNGTSASINSAIYKQASRFIIGKKENFDAYFKIKKLLEDTTFESKVNMMRQVVAKISNDKPDDPSIKLMTHYLNIFDQNGKLTFEEEQDFYSQQMALTAAWKKSRL